MSRLSERIAACAMRENELRAKVDELLDGVMGS